MRTENAGLQPRPDSYFSDLGDKADRTHALGEQPPAPDFGHPPRRDPNTPPRGHERDAERERTQNLMLFL